MRNLLPNCKITRASAVVTAGTSAVNGAAIDMSADGGWDGVMFIASFGTAAANNSIHAEASNDDAVADDYTDLEGTEVDLGGASDEQVVLDIFRPTKRYIRGVALRGTSTTLENMWAIQYRGRKLPYNNNTVGTIASKALITPAEGTI